MPIEDTADFTAQPTNESAPSSTFDEHSSDALDLVNDPYDLPDFAAASRRLQKSTGGDILHNESITETGTTVITPSAEFQKLHEKKFVPNKKRILGVSAVLATGLALTPAIADHFAPPEFSQETKTVIVEDGDGTQSILEKADIDGLETVDWRDVAGHVEDLNQDAYKDGLQAGETISVPISVKK